MGFTPPNNNCSSAIGDQMTNVGGFCTLAGAGGDGYRRDACNGIGNNSGEWEVANDGDGCTYNTCDNKSYFGGSTCTTNPSCCPIVGRGVSCRRKAFNGDPWTCCLRDYACANDNNACYNDNSQRQTCPPLYRDLGGSGCRNLFEDYCSGFGDSSGEWRKLWTKKAGELPTTTFALPPNMDYPCLKLFYRAMYNGTPITCSPGITPNRTVPPSADGFVWSQGLFYKVFNQYLEQGGRPDGNASTPGVDLEFNDTLYTICKAYPGMCASTLQSYCSQYTTQDLATNLNALKWCGCYMPPGEYSKYQNQYQVNPECTPTCNRSDVVPLPSNIGVGQKYCQQTLCIIDDITIALAQSQVGDSSGIQFNQLCSTCGGGSTSGTNVSEFNGTSGYSTSVSNNQTTIISNNIQSTCSCTLSDITIVGVGAKIGDINLSQHCAGTTCYATVPAPAGGTTTVPVDCNADSAIAAGLAQGSQNSNAYKQAELTKHYYMIFFGLALLVVVVIISFVFAPKYNIQEEFIAARVRR